MIECMKCGWSGDPGECVCSDADDKSDKRVNEIQFNLCPQCGEVDNFDEWEDAEEGE